MPRYAFLMLLPLIWACQAGRIEQPEADAEADNPQIAKVIRPVAGTEISYSIAGDSSPALFFIHGLLSNHQHWSNQMESLADSYRVVAVDLPGHGDDCVPVDAPLLADEACQLDDLDIDLDLAGLDVDALDAVGDR